MSDQTAPIRYRFVCEFDEDTFSYLIPALSYLERSVEAEEPKFGVQIGDNFEATLTRIADDE